MATGLLVDLSGNDLVINNLYTGASKGQAGTLISLGSGSVTLGAGTATVAPLTLTSGTNLTTAAAGTIEFDGNAFYATSQASSRQALVSEQYIIQATEPAADNNTGLDTAVAAAFFTANTGAITLVAGKTYFFEACLNLTNTGTTSHTWATVLGGTATFTATGTQYQVTGNSSGTANSAATGALSGFISGSSMSTAVVCTAASTSATEQVAISMSGTLVVNAAGTLIPQLKASARPGASGTPGVTHKAGSYFRIWQVPTLGVVGNWS